MQDKVSEYSSCKLTIQNPYESYIDLVCVSSDMNLLQSYKEEDAMILAKLFKFKLEPKVREEKIISEMRGNKMWELLFIFGDMN